MRPFPPPAASDEDGNRASGNLANPANPRGSGSAAPCTAFHRLFPFLPFLPSSPFFTGRKKLVYAQGNAQRLNEAPTCRLRAASLHHPAPPARSTPNMVIGLDKPLGNASPKAGPMPMVRRQREPLSTGFRAPHESQRKSPGIAAGALVFGEVRRDQPCASTASSSRATMLVILIIGFTAGPAVSL